MDETASAQALRDSEELHRITLLNMSDAVFITDDDGIFTFICPNVDVIFGYGHDEVRTMDRISRLLGRELVTRDQLVASGEVRNIEHDVVTKHGARRALLVHVKQVTIRRGTVLWVCRDITERKETEQELRELSGRLINAHEQERIRLSRELHDEVAQRVAVLSVEQGRLRQDLADAPAHVQEQLAKLSTQTRDIASGLRRLSHELHPARLELLGLEGSIRGFCEELTAAHHIAVDVDIADLPALGPDVVLCFYRITQEALHNVVKHSGANRATLTLGVTGNDVVLSVADDGEGFDPRAVRTKDTLGLVSMRERARLVQGHFAVTSRLGEGTRVDVRVPFRITRPR